MAAQAVDFVAFIELQNRYKGDRQVTEERITYVNPARVLTVTPADDKGRSYIIFAEDYAITVKGEAVDVMMLLKKGGV